jgi:exonuclease III
MNSKAKNRKILTRLANELLCKLNKHQGISIGHLNIRSLLPKVEDIEILLTTSKMDILTISESWLDNSILHHEIAIAGYTAIRKDRNRHGGGVMQYIREGLEYKERTDLEHERIEATWIEVSNMINKGKTLVCSYYRPPDKQTDYFDDTIDMISKAAEEEKEMIICGDFNWNYILDENLVNSKVKQLEDLFMMQQIVEKPTRTENGDKILDLILTISPHNHNYTNVLPIGCSDHYMPYTVVNAHKPAQSHKTAIIRCYKNFDEELFLKDLTQLTAKRNASNDKHTNTSDKIDAKIELEYKWKMWKEDFLSISDKHAPLRTIRMRPGSRSWITTDIVKLMNKRDQMKIAASSTHEPNLWTEYRHLRNKVTRMICNAKRKHYQDLTQQKQSNIKFWKEMTKLIPNKVNMASIPKNLTLDELNTFFSEIGTKTISEVELKKKKAGIPWKGPNSIHNFEIQTVKEQDIAANLEKLKLTTNSDILGMDCKLLRLSSSVISKNLTELLNLSIMSDTVPQDWKIARVTPLYKGNGSKEDPSNYRPISVVCHVAKIFEKVIARQFITYLTNKNLISEDQSAYLEGRSTQTSLHRVIDDILESVDDGDITAACFIDITKCFD